MPRTAKKSPSYTPEFKLEVLTYSDQHGPRAAIEHFDLKDWQVHQWRYGRKNGSLKLPTTNEAIASLTEHATNGNGKHAATPSGLPRGYKARVVARIRNGDRLPHLATIFPLVDLDTLKEWRREAKSRPPVRPGGKYARTTTRKYTKRDKTLVPAVVEMVPDHQPVTPTRPTFQADAGKVLERAQLLEFVLSFLLHS